MNFASSVVSAFAPSDLYVMYVVMPLEASDRKLTPVLATVMPFWTVLAVCMAAPEIFAASPTAFAPVAAASAAALPAAAIPETMLPMLHPSCSAMIEMLTMREAASMALFLSQPYFSCRWSANFSTIVSIAPVSVNVSAVTAITAPAIAKPAAMPPVTMVSATAAATARTAPIQPKMRLILEAFSAFSIFLMDSSICFMRSFCSVSRPAFCMSIRSLAISV